MGLLAEGVGEMRKALILDPLNAIYSRWLGRLLLFGGDYHAVIAQSRKTIDLNADYAYAYLDDVLIVRALAPLGRREEADEILNRLEEESRHHYVRAEILAMGYAAVGDLDRAFAHLERAFQVRSAGLIYLPVDPGYQPLRGDPRFLELGERIGLR